MGEFESGISKNGQTREHALIAYTLGVKQLIVAVNKIDSTKPPYSETRFKEIEKEVGAYLKKIGYNMKAVAFVPVSGMHGDNLVEESSNMPWYKGWNIERKEGNASGITLLKAIDSLLPPEHKSRDDPLRLSVVDVYDIPDVGAVASGVVESGCIEPGMTVNFAPSNISGEVKSVEIDHNRIASGEPGDLVGFHVENVDAKDLKRGMIVSDTGNNPAREALGFYAMVIVLNHPGNIREGYTPVIDIGTAHISCRFQRITEKNDKGSGKLLEEYPKSIKMGDAAHVVMKPQNPVVAEIDSTDLRMCHFVVRDMKQVFKEMLMY